jgi:hypothetical protein
MNETFICPSAVARLFSSSVVREFATRGKSRVAARLLRESGILPSLDPNGTLSDAYEVAFRLLRHRSNRHEYIYKAAITQKVLLGIHNLDTASMLTEFRVGRCKADVVVLNGTGTVYEIKSERDGLVRLQNQVDSYLKVFASVNVIVGENHLEEVLARTPDEAGVMVLSDAYTISSRREAIVDPSRTCPEWLFDAMNLKEAETVLRTTGVDVPPVPNTRRYAVLREMFMLLDPTTAHEGMVGVLKKSRNLSSLKDLLAGVTPCLHSATLSTRIRRRDHARYTQALNTPLEAALLWG